MRKTIPQQQAIQAEYRLSLIRPRPEIEIRTRILLIACGKCCSLVIGLANRILSSSGFTQLSSYIGDEHLRCPPTTSKGDLSQKFTVNHRIFTLWIVPMRKGAFRLFGPSPLTARDRLAKVSREVALHDRFDGKPLWRVAIVVKREQRYATERLQLIQEVIYY